MSDKHQGMGERGLRHLVGGLPACCLLDHLRSQRRQRFSSSAVDVESGRGCLLRIFLVIGGAWLALGSTRTVTDRTR